jgi:Glycosyltransferase (GlcNAc)
MVELILETAPSKCCVPSSRCCPAVLCTSEDIWSCQPAGTIFVSISSYRCARIVWALMLLHSADEARGPWTLRHNTHNGQLTCRDDECSYTVQHMFDQADVPERIFVGVCEQNWRERESCQTGHLPLRLRDHVQYQSFNASMAKGPTYGRALAQTLYNEEDFYMQVRSHWAATTTVYARTRTK